MTADPNPGGPPHHGWHHTLSGDWAYYVDGEQAGIVCYQDRDGRRVWYSVSVAKSHGPEAGTLTKCKRRLETLWK